MASQYVKDLLRGGLPETLDRFLGNDTGYEAATPPINYQPGPGYNDADQQPVDGVPNVTRPDDWVPGVQNSTVLLGGVGVLLAVGLIVAVSR